MSKLKKALLFIITNTVLIIIAWSLNMIHLPDNIKHIDYFIESNQMIDTTKEPNLELQIINNGKIVKKLKSYKLYFINRSSSHLENINIEIPLNIPKSTQLVSFSISTPKDFSSRNSKIDLVDNNTLICNFNYINRAEGTVEDLYYINMIFSNNDEEIQIVPIINNKGIKFRPISDNKKSSIIAILIILAVIIAYILLLSILFRIDKKNLVKKDSRYKEELINLLSSENYKNTPEIVGNKIIELRKRVYKTPNKLKVALKKLLE